MGKSPDAFRTISEVAAQLETPPHVLRFWETKFPQLRPVKRQGGRRYYRPDDIALLVGLKLLLHEKGMTIRGVQNLLKEKGARHVAGLSALPWEGDDAGEAADTHEPHGAEEEEGVLVTAVEEEEASPAETMVVGPWPGAGATPAAQATEARPDAPADDPLESERPPTLLDEFLRGTLSRLAQPEEPDTEPQAAGAGGDADLPQAAPSAGASVPPGDPLARLRAALASADPDRLRGASDRLLPLILRLEAAVPR